MQSIPRMMGAPKLIKSSSEGDTQQKQQKPRGGNDRPAWRDYVGAPLIERENIYMPQAYRSAESSQTEQTAYLASAGNTNWQTLYTVPTGRKFYLTCFWGYCDGTQWRTDFGKSSATMWLIASGTGVTEYHVLTTPILFTAGEIIQVKRDSSSGIYLMGCIGYLE